MKKRVLFIINPLSGGRKKLNFPQVIEQHLDREKFEADFVFSEYPGHAYRLATDAARQDFDIVVAVGGDGTINEVASALVSTGKVMGIVPSGSGNGLARALHLPLNTVRAVRKLNELKVLTIDSARLNEFSFFNVAGMGFDAHISALFAEEKRRGFKGYIKTTLHEIITYKSQRYTIHIDGRQLEREAFMVSIANSSQFGNNAYISPQASVSDGLLDICIIKPFPLYLFPLMVYYMFSKTAHKSKYVEIIRGKRIRITRESAGAIHVDGEPRNMGEEINVEVNPSSLAVLN